jgi:hypothetical protein
VTDDEKDAARVKLFPAAIALAIILLAPALDVLFPIELAVRIPAPLRYWLGGAVAVGSVVCLGAWSVLIMRRSGQSENPWKPTTSIIERGPFERNVVAAARIRANYCRLLPLRPDSVGGFFAT